MIVINVRETKHLPTTIMQNEEIKIQRRRHYCGARLQKVSRVVVGKGSRRLLAACFVLLEDLLPASQNHQNLSRVSPFTQHPAHISENFWEFLINSCIPRILSHK